MSDEIINGQTENLSENGEELSLSEILQIRRDKLSDLRTGGRDPFDEVRYDRTVSAGEIVENFDAMDGCDVRIAGRMMSKRDMGKAYFVDLRDRSGKIQIYVRVNDVGEEAYAEFKKYDIGDIIGVSGKVFRTRRGEISIHAESIILLSKSLLPLPEKFHGLRDLELRYRERYVDLIVNHDVTDTFIKRSKIIKSIRDFLDARGYIEVETPILQTVPGGANARPFLTHHNTLDIDMHLRISLELYLKRLIVGGLEKVYEIGRVFRNEGMSQKHNPEFTLLELYEAYTDYEGMMSLTEELFEYVCTEVNGSTTVTFNSHEIDFKAPWPRMSMIEAVKTHTGVDFDEIETDEAARAAAKSLGVETEEKHTRGDVISLVFEERAEKHLIQPVFLTDYPVEISPLAKRKKEDPRLTYRFELFVAGSEMANAFSELNDPVDQRERFERQVKLREEGDEEATMMDEDFIKALEYGMPPTGGIGIGIDRMVMLLTGNYFIRDVLLFPTMKPKD